VTDQCSVGDKRTRLGGKRSLLDLLAASVKTKTISLLSSILPRLIVHLSTFVSW